MSFLVTFVKNLYLIRHAEASGQNAHVRDFDRPLNSHGVKDSSRMGDRLRGSTQLDVMISSPAIRAKTTATVLARAINFPSSSIIFDERIYEAEVDDLFAAISDVDDTLACAMLVGHNPALTQLVNVLAQCDIGNMPTCSMAVLRFPSNSWSNVATVKAELLAFDYPGNEAG